jgi:ATP-binding cassette subfamily B (MDR/TAP) protein 1
VPQEPFLFPGTIRDNIALGRLDATDEEVERAAKAACAHEFIKELPEGYDTLYSGASIQLSGGQLQRLSLARAMVRNPSILILDEATSALDTTSERQVQEAIENIRKHTSVTTVTIAHRLSTIVTSDKIAVISDGGIAEQGTHHELLVQGGIYASLCETQGITLDSKFEPIDTSERTNVSVKYSSIKKSMAKSVAGVEEGGVLNKEEEEKLAKQEELASVSRLWESNKPELGYLVMGSLGAIMVGGLLPCEGILTAQIVSNFYTQEPNDMLDANRPYILGFLALAGGSIIGNILSGCGFSVAGYRLTRRMRGQVFESIIRRDMGWFRLPGAFDR